MKTQLIVPEAKPIELAPRPQLERIELHVPEEKTVETIGIQVVTNSLVLANLDAFESRYGPLKR